MALAALIAVMIMGIFLLTGVGYMIYLRFRGKCHQCPEYLDQLKKWERGELKYISKEMVRHREQMSDVDVEKGNADLDGQANGERAKSLASLEGRSMADSDWSGRTFAVVDLQSPPPAHDVRQQDRGASQVPINEIGPNTTYSLYIRDIVGPREAERIRSIEEAEDDTLKRHLDAAHNPKKRDSSARRAFNRVNDVLAARKEREQARPSPPSPSVYEFDEDETEEETLKPTVYQSQGTGSRFVEDL